MVDTVSANVARQNYERAIPQAGTNYKAGVERATNVIEKSIAAEQNYVQGIQDAISNNRRVKGLQKTSTADWKSKASTLGATRIGPGMSANTAKYERGMGEVISVLQGITLPPRTADPIANVQNRVIPIVTALHELKNR